MADVSDSRLADAYAAVRSDSDPTTWAVAGYDPSSKDKIVLEATGTGSLNELSTHFHEDGCQFAYLRVTTGDEESKRAKFVFIAWTGPKAGILRKAKVSVHKANVKQVFRDFAVETQFADQEDIDEQKLIATVVKAGGANYMGQTHA
jgi:hypothetical protein